ncbi:hypothetical protein QE152_g33247 [Popillia japonica]|uniref:Uncharacterized protein n=1 Tax=Popillia japonica TaxID=7064 RepID=A0AAW1IY10_POPJA
MPVESGDRVTRSKFNESEELLIQRVVERILSNESFLNRLLATVKDTLDNHDTSIKKLETTVSSLDTKLDSTRDEVEWQEQYSRLNNLRLFGIPETNGAVT